MKQDIIKQNTENYFIVFDGEENHYRFDIPYQVNRNGHTYKEFELTQKAFLSFFGEKPVDFKTSFESFRIVRSGKAEILTVSHSKIEEMIREQDDSIGPSFIEKLCDMLEKQVDSGPPEGVTFIN